jgi:aminoglycoside/choline kinase family phosphotransferase
MIPESFSKKGWQLLEPFGSDASPRHYSRLIKNGRTAMLMDSSAEKESVPDFVRIGEWLRSVDIRAPQIYESEIENGFLLLEDFGDVSFKKAINSGSDKLLYYVLATDVLKHLYAQKSLPDLPDYYSSRVHKAHRWVIDWYLPSVKKTQSADGVAERYLEVWKSIEDSLPPCPTGFVHGDFHLENLMVLNEGEGLAHCGVIDFQDAMRGPLPYDLANLLEDIRSDIPDEIRNAMMAYYTSDMKPEKAEAFELWYRVLRTQFHCRIAGWCIKKAVADGKPRYMEFLPRVEAYIKKALKEPLFQPLKTFFDDLKLDFNAANGLNAALNAEEIKDFIRSEAFK